MPRGYDLSVDLPEDVRRDLRIRIFSRIITDGRGCWNWVGSIKPGGYGNITYKKVVYNAHRISFAVFSGTIPAGLTIDHLCKNRRCLNPQHMEIVTAGENALRGGSSPAMNAKKRVCKRGHELVSLSDKRKGHSSAKRHCPICERMDALSWNQNHKERKNANNRRYARNKRLAENPEHRFRKSIYQHELTGRPS